MKIIVDTNFLIYSLRFKIDIVSELRGHSVFVLSRVIKELEWLSRKKSQDSMYAKLALSLIKRKSFKRLKSIEKTTDMSLVAYSKKGYAIATQDREIIKNVKRHGGKLIYLRQKKYVVFE